ncbi:MAG: hypothetical protein K0S38_173 [Candidatus Paceibacter sp.]|jgi:mRNA-degrading endonuclease toxin of MazEF toxin-antitoxin module|nr:hypothetical protein [Candidatus Paceibacter sp.]
MDKDFDTWNQLKKQVHNKEELLYCHTREIWWCSLGVNIGSEEDGKNHLFERPVLIIKIFNKHMVRAIPLTSKRKDDNNHVSIYFLGDYRAVKLSQLKTISTKRLSRKLGMLDDQQFENVIKRLIENLI